MGGDECGCGALLSIEEKTEERQQAHGCKQYDEEASVPHLIVAFDGREGIIMLLLKPASSFSKEINYVCIKNDHSPPSVSSQK